jgi:DNA polymerase/3'-5' exonuclease PolX
MNLPIAQKYAVDILNWLQPTCLRCEITGSIRRRRAAPADIDLCLIPKETIYQDLLGHVTGRQNHTWMFLVNYVNSFKPATLKSGQRQPAILTGGSQPGHRMTVQLPACQLDIWFATEETWASKIVQSTGSMEHNIWLAQRAADHGLHWFVSQGLARLDTLDHQGIQVAIHDAPRRARAANLILPALDETEFYKHLGLAWIEPQNRELLWLQKHIDSSL